MTATTKAILVIPSAGERSPAQIPEGLVAYCAALAAVPPIAALRTEERNQDLGQLNLAASVKGSQIRAAEYGVTMDWTPVDYHVDDESEPGTWADGVNTRGVRYAANVGGATYYVFVQMAT